MEKGHNTQKGRIVYDRKSHPFSPADVKRILRSFSDEDTGYFQEHFEQFFTVFVIAATDTILGSTSEEDRRKLVETLFRFIEQVDPGKVLLGIYL